MIVVFLTVVGTRHRRALAGAIKAIEKGGSVDLEDRIINSIDNSCASKMVDEIDDLDAGLQFTIKEIFGSEDSNYDLTYVDVDGIQEFEDGSRGAAETDWTVNSNGKITSIQIKLDDLFLDNATDVAIFTTILHENMHATMLYQLDSAGIPFTDNSVNYDILSEIWSQYVARIRREKDENRKYISYYQHEVMSELVEKMIPLVLNFGIEKGYHINSFTAEAICWAGLEGTTAYRELDDEIKETYENLIENEYTGFEILSIGKKCGQY